MLSYERNALFESLSLYDKFCMRFLALLKSFVLTRVDGGVSFVDKKGDWDIEASEASIGGLYEVPSYEWNAYFNSIVWKIEVLYSILFPSIESYS